MGESRAMSPPPPVTESSLRLGIQTLTFGGPTRQLSRLSSRAKDKIGGTPVVKVDERRSEQTTGKY